MKIGYQGQYVNFGTSFTVCSYRSAAYHMCPYERESELLTSLLPPNHLVVFVPIQMTCSPES